MRGKTSAGEGVGEAAMKPSVREEPGGEKRARDDAHKRSTSAAPKGLLRGARAGHARIHPRPGPHAGRGDGLFNLCRELGRILREHRHPGLENIEGEMIRAADQRPDV